MAQYPIAVKIRRSIFVRGSIMNKTIHFGLIGGLGAVLVIGGLSGCAMWEGKQARETGRTVDQYKNDRIVSGRVHEALKTAPIYKFPDVHIDTYAGTVQLSGFVHTEDQKRQAEQIARSVPGVHQVIDNLALIPQTPQPTGREQGYPNNVPNNQVAPVINPNYPNNAAGPR
jgi:hyperosmotically inducible protein